MVLAVAEPRAAGGLDLSGQRVDDESVLFSVEDVGQSLSFASASFEESPLVECTTRTSWLSITSEMP
jgi:hypothetical protein